jgi:rhodanese-related sulfurtransferase
VNRRQLLAHLLVTAAALLFCACTENRQEQSEGAGVPTVSTTQLDQWLRSGEPFLLIDVRQPEEWRGGHAAGAIHIPRVLLSNRIESVAPDKSTRIVLYCLSGKRSAFAARTQIDRGYTQVYSLAGGFRQYTRDGLPVSR